MGKTPGQLEGELAGEPFRRALPEIAPTVHDLVADTNGRMDGLEEVLGDYEGNENMRSALVLEFGKRYRRETAAFLIECSDVVKLQSYLKLLSPGGPYMIGIWTRRKEFPVEREVTLIRAYFHGDEDALWRFVSAYWVNFLDQTQAAFIEQYSKSDERSKPSSPVEFEIDIRDRVIHLVHPDEEQDV